MSETPEKKKRSPVERLIVWGLIGIMLVVLLIEYRATTNHKGVLERLSEMNPSNRLTLDELKAEISGASVSKKELNKMGTAEVEFSFFSIFKADKYKVRVQLADIPEDGTKEQIAKLSKGGGIVVGYYQPETLAAERDRKREPVDLAAGTPPEDSPDPASGMGMGMGGGAPEDEEHDDDSTDANPTRPGDDGPGGGGRPGGGGNRGGRRGGMAAIAANPEVKSKLKITDEQSEKLQEVTESNQLDWASLREMERAEQMAAFTEYRTKIENGIKEVLDAEQFETIQRMAWAQAGPMALVQEAVATKLGLTEDQVAELAKIRAEADRRNPPVDEMLAVLNDEQKAKWSELIEGMEPPVPPLGAQGGGRPERNARPTIED